MVYYRKYRPQTIEQLDSEDVRKTLSSVLTHPQIPHAFLFTGPKGLGKTSTARIVAKYVNCEGKKEKPCSKCDSCVSITNGTNLDVLEIDGASNRGIDEIRDLREKIRLLPVSATKKVYIIDEVHMLTTEAFNALLKTIEEPPPHAMLILCTTEEHKVPSTILSRCFHIAFKKASDNELVHSFERILKAEKLAVDSDALSSIASFADGSFRDGVKVLEEIVMKAKGKKITAALVADLYQMSGLDADIISLLQSFLIGDRKKGLAVVERLVAQGTDIKYFLEQVLVQLHKQLLIKAGISEGKEMPDMDMDMIKNLVVVLSKAHTEIKSAVLPSLPLELVIVEWGDEGKGESVKGKVIEQEPPVIARSEPTKQSLSDRHSGDEHSEDSRIDSGRARMTVQDDKTLLHQILDTIKAEHHMLAGVLRSCRLSRTEEAIVIEAPSSFHSERLKDKKALEVLEKVCKDITGKEVTISVVLK